MVIQKRPAERGQKFWKIARVVFQRKILVEAIHMLLKRGKTAGKAMSNLNYYSSCRSDDINASFVSPRAYEFSCSNTPNYKNQSEEVKVMRRVLEILEASPVPEFGGSPEQHQVDKDAEEFIIKFYMDLKKQKRIAAALGSPSPYHQFMA